MTEEQEQEIKDFLEPYMGKTVWGYSPPGQHAGMQDTLLILVAADTPLPAFPFELGGYRVELMPLPRPEAH